MGLTVYYNLQINTDSVKEVKSVINQIREKALDLPFTEVSEIIDVQGEDCKAKDTTEESMRWILNGCIHSVKIGEGRGYQSYIDAYPKRVIGFSIIVGNGCEPLDIVVAQYNKTVKYELKAFPWRNRTYQTNKVGWSGRGFCKTQYASNPDCGGIKNFLRCHISVVTLLEFAQSLTPVTLEIKDEGKWGTSNYTDDPSAEKPIYYLHAAKHDVKALIEEIGEWNQMIAAFSGALKDALVKNGQDPQNLLSAIDDFPAHDREVLEAKGVEKFTHIRENMGV